MFSEPLLSDLMHSSPSLKPQALHPKPEALNPKPKTLQTLNAEPYEPLETQEADCATQDPQRFDDSSAFRGLGFRV